MAANLAGMAFVPYYNHMMQILETNKDLKKTAKGIFTQVGYAAGGAAIGGVCAGPPGALVGGIAGSIYGYMCVDHYDSLISVLREMSDDEKKALVEKVQGLVGSAGIEGLTSFVASQVNREIFIHLIREFTQSGQNATRNWHTRNSHKCVVYGETTCTALKRKHVIFGRTIYTLTVIVFVYATYS